MATALEMFSNIQFSTLRFASSHIPAQAVALTKASHKGTVDGVKFFSVMYKIRKPPPTMDKTMRHSFLLVKVMGTGGKFFFLTQYHQP